MTCAWALVLAGCGGDAALAEGNLRDWGPRAAAVAPCDGDAKAVPKREGALCTDDGWCWESAFPTGVAAHDLARVGDELWAPSEMGILRFDGQEWRQAGQSADHLIGSTDGSAFAATRREAALFDGSAWKRWAFDEFILGIAGSPGSTMWVVIEGVNRGSPDARPALLRLEGDEWIFDADLEVPTGVLLAVRSAQDLWVDGPGYVSHFDGTSWTKTSLAELVPGIVPDAYSAVALHVAGERDVWLSVGTGVTEPSPDGRRIARGALFRHDGTRFVNVEGSEDVALVTDIEGADPSDLWFGTVAGEILHWNGSTLSRDGEASADRPLADFARTRDGRIFAMYSSSFTNGIVEREGGMWVDHALTGPSQVAKKVWGSAWNDVWAVGTNGLRMHFDGTHWATAAKARGEVTGIWGQSAHDVWTVSQRGDIDHYDGQKWTTLLETGLDLVDVWGLGEGELWMTVNEPSIPVGVAHFVRGKLETFPDGAGINRAIWASSSSDVYVAMQSFWSYMHYDGEAWTWRGTTPNSNMPPFRRVDDFWGRGPDDVYALEQGGSLFHFDGVDWSIAGSPAGFTALFGCGESLFAAGEYGLGLLRGNEWDLSMEQGRGITGFWAASPSFGVAVGTGGKILRRSR